ncbi:hypothetical protein AB0J21_10985 [Streptomyces sp. NPDC049954]|uniref:hypothetical protein n=1 Tax=Streptomyces sp. NPDC049954 TaxID=3155779 RepID=UPI0034202CC6
MTSTTGRIFLPLSESPLSRPLAPAEDMNAVMRLAHRATPTPKLVKALLSVGDPQSALRVAYALDARDDLPPEALALLVAARPELRASVARLRRDLFPGDTGSCHSFARTIAQILYAPSLLDADYLDSPKFARAAAHADPGVLLDLLAELLAKDSPAPAAVAALQHLSDARTHAKVAVAALDLRTDAACARWYGNNCRRLLHASRSRGVAALTAQTNGLSLLAETWYSALVDAVETPAQEREALAAIDHAPKALAAGQPLVTPSPAADARWPHLIALAARRSPASDRWRTAWDAAEHTPDGSAWDPVQRGLVAGYELLTEHTRSRLTTSDELPTPDRFWAADPDGRALLHRIADGLTGYLGHSPLPHFDETLLIAFIRGLAKNRRDKVPGALHVHGLVASLKAARSKASVITRATPTDIGLVIPMRGEAERAAATADVLGVKWAQLTWLVDQRPDARINVLLVDEDPDQASTKALAQPPAHPQITLRRAARPDAASAKGGAVLWGLGQLVAAGAATVAYTDLDLTYPLDQLGVLQAALDTKGAVAAIGSRVRPDSYGYYRPGGPSPTTQRYRTLVQELLGLDVRDPQAGFKAFPSEPLGRLLPRIAERGLSFDTGLLAALSPHGKIVETGIAALHRYTDAPTGTPRDYDAMLRAVHLQAHRNGRPPEERPTPAWDRYLTAGTLRAMNTPDEGGPAGAARP